MSECQCDLRTYLVGDGCSVCNPAYWNRISRKNCTDLEGEIERLRAFVRAWDAWRNQPDDVSAMLLFADVDAAREAVGDVPD